jgi:hypothetical protein
MKTQRKLVEFFQINGIEASACHGQVLVDAPIKRVEHLVARRGGKCSGLKVGRTSNRANANQKLVAFKASSPDGTLKFAREERRVTSITIG